MVAVNITAIARKPNTANRQIESHIFFAKLVRPCNTNIVYAKFEVFRTFLCMFMGVLWIFVC